MAAVLMSSVHGQKFAPSGARLGGSVRASDKVRLMSYVPPKDTSAICCQTRKRTPSRARLLDAAALKPLLETSLPSAAVRHGTSLVITRLGDAQVLLARPAHPAARRHPARGRAPRRTVTPPSAVGGPLFETALVLPALVPTLVRGALAGVVVYSTLQWSFARKFRKEVPALALCMLFYLDVLFITACLQQPWAHESIAAAFGDFPALNIVSLHIVSQQHCRMLEHRRTLSRGPAMSSAQMRRVTLSKDARPCSQAQKQLDEDAVGETDRQERLRRLQGIKDADNGKDGKSE